MAPPEYDDKETYTADEMRHVVSREVMKYRVNDMDASIKRNAELSDAMFTKIFTKIDESLVEIRIMILKSSDDIEKCRKDLKAEIENDYATKLELQELRGEIRLLSLKIVMGTGVLVTLIQFIFDKVL